MANFSEKHQDMLLHFSKKKNIHPKRIIEHKNVDDLDILLSIREVYWKDMNNNEQAFWGALWGVSFVWGHKLKSKHFEKLEGIVVSLNSPERKREKAFRIIREVKAKSNAH